jgi:hypothetical protein
LSGQHSKAPGFAGGYLLCRPLQSACDILQHHLLALRYRCRLRRFCGCQCRFGCGFGDTALR